MSSSPPCTGVRLPQASSSAADGASAEKRMFDHADERTDAVTDPPWGRTPMPNLRQRLARMGVTG